MCLLATDALGLGPRISPAAYIALAMQIGKWRATRESSVQFLHLAFWLQLANKPLDRDGTRANLRTPRASLIVIREAPLNTYGLYTTRRLLAACFAFLILLRPH